MAITAYKTKPVEEKTSGKDRIDLLASADDNVKNAVEVFTSAKITEGLAKAKMDEARLVIEDHLVSVASEHGAEVAYKAGDLQIGITKPRVPSKTKSLVVDELLGLDQYFPTQSVQVKLLWSLLSPEIQDLCEPLVYLMDQAGGGDEESIELLKKIKAKHEQMHAKNADRPQIGLVQIDEGRALSPTVNARSFFQTIADMEPGDRDYFTSSVGLPIMIRIPNDAKAKRGREAVRNAEEL